MNLSDNTIDYEDDSNYRGNPRYKDDDKLHVRFYKGAREDKTATLKAGRRICTEHDYVEIIAPGGKGAIVNRPATPDDKLRFRDRYQRYQKDQDQAVSGTPLSLWPGVDTAQAKELEYFKIFTIEQLAALPDTAAQQFMGGNTLKAKAHEYLEATKDNAALNEMQAKVERTNAENKALKQQMQTMVKRLDQLEEADTQQNAPLDAGTAEVVQDVVVATVDIAASEVEKVMDSAPAEPDPTIDVEIGDGPKKRKR